MRTKQTLLRVAGFFCFCAFTLSTQMSSTFAADALMVDPATGYAKPLRDAGSGVKPLTLPPGARANDGTVLPGTASAVTVAKTVFVDPANGHDSGSSIGLRERTDRPFATLSAAVGVAQAGDTIEINANISYSGAVTISVPLVLDFNGHKITAASQTDTRKLSLLADYCAVRHLEGNGTWNHSSSGTTTGSFIYCANKHVTLEDIDIHDVNDEAIRFNGDFSGANLVDIKVDYTKSAIYFDSGAVLVLGANFSRLTLTNITGKGLAIAAGGVALTNWNQWIYGVQIEHVYYDNISASGPEAFYLHGLSDYTVSGVVGSGNVLNISNDTCQHGTLTLLNLRGGYSGQYSAVELAWCRWMTVSDSVLDGTARDGTASAGDTSGITATTLTPQTTAAGSFDFTNVTSIGWTKGIYLVNVYGARISNSHLQGTFAGISLAGSGNIQIVNNDIEANGTDGYDSPISIDSGSGGNDTRYSSVGLNKTFTIIGNHFKASSGCSSEVAIFSQDSTDTVDRVTVVNNTRLDSVSFSSGAVKKDSAGGGSVTNVSVAGNLPATGWNNDPPTANPVYSTFQNQSGSGSTDSNWNTLEIENGILGSALRFNTATGGTHRPYIDGSDDLMRFGPSTTRHQFLELGASSFVETDSNGYLISRTNSQTKTDLGIGIVTSFLSQAGDGSTDDNWNTFAINVPGILGTAFRGNTASGGIHRPYMDFSDDLMRFGPATTTFDFLGPIISPNWSINTSGNAIFNQITADATNATHLQASNIENIPDGWIFPVKIDWTTSGISETATLTVAQGSSTYVRATGTLNTLAISGTINAALGSTVFYVAVDASSYPITLTIPISKRVTGDGGSSTTITFNEKAIHKLAFDPIPSGTSGALEYWLTDTVLPTPLTGDIATGLVTAKIMSGTPTLADTKVALADNTTGNASTSAHGYQAKGTGSSSTFYRSDNTQAPVTASNVGLGNVTNDAQTKAAIFPNTAPSSGQLPIGNSGGTAYAPQTISGSGATISLNNAGVLSISSIPNSSLTNSAITIAGTSTSLGGTITLNTILNSIGSVAQGDILYYNGTNWIYLAPGTSGQFLETLGAGANPAWATPTGGSVATDSIFTAKGDLPVGTGSSTAAKLAVGTNGQLLTADSTQTTGAKWTSPNPIILSLSSDQPITGTSFGDIPGLSFSVAANTRYDFVCYIPVNETGTAGYKIQITGPLSPTYVNIVSTGSASAAITGASDFWTGFSSQSSTYGTYAGDGRISITGVIVNGSNAGTVQIQAEKLTSGTVTFKTGADIKVFTQ